MGREPRAMRRRNKRPDRRGAALIEFALVASLFFLLVLTLIEFGRMVMVQQAISNAAREGGRKAALVTTTNATEVDDAVRDFLRGSISASTSSKAQVTTAPATLAGLPAGTPITVAVQVDFADATWLPVSAVTQDVVIQSSSTMERE